MKIVELTIEDSQKLRTRGRTYGSTHHKLVQLRSGCVLSPLVRVLCVQLTTETHTRGFSVRRPQHQENFAVVLTFSVILGELVESHVKFQCKARTLHHLLLKFEVLLPMHRPEHRLK